MNKNFTTTRLRWPGWLPSVALLLVGLAGSRGAVFLKDNIDRPLRYFPEGRDFVITNGMEFFNRPLYCLNSAFRADGGDKPEFSLYLPGRGGNLRLGIKTPAGVKWLNDAGEIIACYCPGSLLYEIHDPLLGNRELHLAVLPLSQSKGIILRAELQGIGTPVELVWAFGGANGMRGRRNGDIGCETKPVGEFFQLAPEQCKDDKFTIATNGFVLRSKTATISGSASTGTAFTVADATHWPSLRELLVSSGKNAELPVVVGSAEFHPGQPLFFALQQIDGEQKSENPGDLEQVFAAAEEHRRAIADRVVVETPDAFVNAAASALNVAADAVWDEQQQSFMHGAVAWRVRLLGWRGPYAGDELGWHERTAMHFAGYARQQNTNPIPEKLPPADADANLSRNEVALHSNGDLTKTHYDMNLVGMDAFFRHLLWTGDLDYARKMWPVIERHLAWERRLFRREFGTEKLPLYEAYCCIWASDDVAYNGGGATHSSAYNFYHNTMAARVAKLIGKDPSPFEREAELIAKAMRRELWLGDRGWFGESKDLLGLQLVHPNAAAWTFYHTIDSEVPTPLEAWQMSRFVDTQIARIPLRGPGVPPECFTMPTTSWMPYSWSVNNVVMAEVAHTSLAYWQVGRADAAFPLFKGAVMDSMFIGLCPGNVGMCTWFDTYRRESQRDFADGVGAMSRALIEGLFGVQPDMLAGELKIRPGFPAEWNHANIHHPDFNFAFRRDGEKETFLVEQKFSKSMALRLQLPAIRDDIAQVTVNGEAAKWNAVEDSVGAPRVEIRSAAVARHEVVIAWKGQALAPAKHVAVVGMNKEFEAQFSGEELTRVQDPQQALAKLVVSKSGFRGQATGAVRYRTVFALVRQGQMTLWQPVQFEIRADAVPDAASVTDWKKPLPATTKFEPVHLESFFNDKVTQIFRNRYLSPCSPFCSLAIPAQGFGSWCHPQDEFNVDDSGLRTAAKADGKITLPNGVPLATPSVADEKNIIFTSQWDNYPREVAVPLTGKSSHAFLLMAGSTSAMQSRFDNGEIIVTYADGSTVRLALRNPTTWWPIDQDYYIDDFAFSRPEPLPPRVDLKTGKVRVLEMETFEGKGRIVPGGAATVLDLPLDASKELKSLAVRALANEVVIGLMSVTLER